MSRLEIVDSWLQRWADRRTRITSAACDDAPEAGDDEIDGAVASLPEPLKITIEECYLRAGDHAVHAARLGCPSWTLSRRLSRAHRLLHDTLLDRRAKAQHTREVAEMRRLLADAPSRATGRAGRGDA